MKAVLSQAFNLYTTYTCISKESVEYMKHMKKHVFPGLERSEITSGTMFNSIFSNKLVCSKKNE